MLVIIYVHNIVYHIYHIYIYNYIYYYYYYYYIYLSAHVQRTKQALGIAPHEALFKKKKQIYIYIYYIYQQGLITYMTLLQNNILPPPQHNSWPSISCQPVR